MPENILERAVGIVSAYVSNNRIPMSELTNAIGSVHATLTELSTGSAPAPVEAPKEPAVPIKKSVTPDYIICLEDGKKFKSLKRHLRTAYNLTPEQYREKWKLPKDYPMVAPAYAEQRSALAKAIGLGQKAKGRKRAK